MFTISFLDMCILSSVCSEDLVCIWKLLPLTKDWYRLGAEPGFENSYEHLSPEMAFEMETMQLAALGEAHGNGKVEIYGAITVPLWMLPSRHSLSLPGFVVLVSLYVFLCLFL